MPLLLLYKKMVEYHDILWDIATAKNSGVSDVEVLYKYAPPISSFFNWRDSRVMDEISWYGWFIGKFMNPMYQHKSCFKVVTLTIISFPLRFFR